MIKKVEVYRKEVSRAFQLDIYKTYTYKTK